MKYYELYVTISLIGLFIFVIFGLMAIDQSAKNRLSHPNCDAVIYNTADQTTPYRYSTQLHVTPVRMRIIDNKTGAYFWVDQPDVMFNMDGTRRIEERK